MSAALPRATSRPATRPLIPFPGTASMSVASCSAIPRASAPWTIAAASGCSDPRSTEAARASSSPSPVPAPMVSTSVSSGVPAVRVPVLSTTSVSTCARLSSAAASRTSTPSRAPRPVATMIDMGVASPSAHGQAMTRTLTATRRAWESAGSGPTSSQTANRDQRHRDHCRHKPARNTVHEPLDRRAASLRGGNQVDDPGKDGVRPDSLGTHAEQPGAVERACGHRVAGRLFDGYRLPREHALVDCRTPAKHHPVDRDALAGPNLEPVADPNHFERHVLVAVVADPARGLRREIEERADGIARALAGGELEHLSDEHEKENHRCGFEVDRRQSMWSTHRCGEEVRRKHRNHAECIGRTRTEGNQGPHVEAAVNDRRPAAPKKWSRHPGDNRGSKKKLEPDVEERSQAIRQRGCRGAFPSRGPALRGRGGRRSKGAVLKSTSSGLGPASGDGTMGSSAMPQIGQSPGASRTISGSIGQV